MGQQKPGICCELVYQGSRDLPAVDGDLSACAQLVPQLRALTGDHPVVYLQGLSDPL